MEDPREADTEKLPIVATNAGMVNDRRRILRQSFGFESHNDMVKERNKGLPPIDKRKNN